MSQLLTQVYSMVDFKKELFANAYKKRIPLIVTIEIIGQCNFRCVHCYIDNNRRKDMLTYDEIVDFGNQVIQMGCLYVVLTGGEVLLHPDFEKIYLFFVKKGVCVSVFTNASLITTNIIELFRKYPPRVVESTIYGFSSDTYEAVTRLKAFERVRENILRLKQNGINILLKMFVVNENYQEFQDVQQFSKEHNIPFKYDSMIIAAGGTEEINHQISDERIIELIKKEMVTAAKFNEETYHYIIGSQNRKLYLCGGGRNSCWLKSNNYLRICNFLDNIEFDLKKYKVWEAWTMMQRTIEEKLSEFSECSNCSYRIYCDYCPAKSYAFYAKEDMELHPDIYCKVAKIRACMQRSDK